METLTIMDAPLAQDTGATAAQPPPAGNGDAEQPAERKPGTTEASPLASTIIRRQASLAAKSDQAEPQQPKPAESTDALAKEIRERILAAQAEKAKRDAAKTDQQASRSIQPVKRPATVGQAAAKPAQQAQTKQSGCGPTGDVPAPSPNGPHPKWTCEQPTVTIDPTWRGQPLVFKFPISNQGEADLHIHLKGG
ncbi:MAG: hypothetical protein JXO22_16905 [Phycisphaerae bacterium]|nr:hypothetical protein [Phycisphaerae bacterium]